MQHDRPGQISSLKLVDNIASEFEQSWQRGQGTRIEDIVTQYEGQVPVEILLPELILVEIELSDRRESTDQLIQEYLERFPSLSRETLNDVLSYSRKLEPKTRSLPPVANVTADFDRVNVICGEFEGKWKSQNRPQIAEALEQVDLHSQANLFRNLMDIEIRQRRINGEQPQEEEYLNQFPDQDGLVRQAFLDSVQFSVKPDETSIDETESFEIPKANRLGSYVLGQELGRGGMGVVYRASHSKHGSQVALKTLPEVDGVRLHKFKREFRALADINHPNLVGLHTLESDGNHWFFTMDLIQGEDFYSHVRPGGHLDESRLRSALGQLVVGVAALHGHQIIHRDLKPTNVMVTSDGQTIVLDFGLVSELNQRKAPISNDRISGTPAYMSPEQAMNEESTPASDWYSVGVMLYESLCGHRPFKGQIMKMLSDKREMDAPPLPDDPSIPQDLAKLCLSLLARDPSQRPGAETLLEMLPVSSTDTATPIQNAAVTTLLGREKQLAALKESLRDSELKREPIVVFVSGKSGEGKSSLVDLFLKPLINDRSRAVLSGRCYDRESVPFKALDSLIDALASLVRTLPDLEAALLLPDDIALLAQVFPILNRVEVIASKPKPFVKGLDEQQVRKRAFSALRELLRRIGERTPLILFCDDIQWGDADSAEVLEEILRPPGAPNLLFIGSFRSDEADASPFLIKWRELTENKEKISSCHVAVGPLSKEKCIQLAINHVGRDSAEIRQLAEQLAHEAGGNPFLLTELLDCCNWQEGSYRQIPITEVVEQKLTRLPSAARNLLYVIAISGQALDIEEASQTAGDSNAAFTTLTHMRNERLVRLLGNEDHPQVDTYHDKIRETIIGHLSVDRRCEIHKTLAETIEANAGDVAAELVASLENGGEEQPQHLQRLYDLAYHFDAAGDTRKALVYGLLAAEQARRQYALDVSSKFYSIAKRNSGDASAAIRYRIAAGFGETLTLLGRYQEGVDQLEGAIDLTENPKEKAHIDWLQGSLAFRQGHVEKSQESLESGLRRLGVWVPRTRAGLFVGAAWESFKQALHSMLPFRLHRTPYTERRHLETRIFTTITQPYIFSSTLKSIWGHLSGMNRAELVTRSPGLAKIYGLHAGFCSMLGWQSRGTKYGARSMAVANEFNDIAERGFGCNYYGVGLYGSAQYDQGLKVIGQAIDAIDAAGGDLFEYHLAKFHKAACHYGLGDLKAVVEEVGPAFLSAARVNESRTMCLSWIWARATRGNIPFKQLEKCIPNRPDDIMSTVHALMAEGLWHSFHGRTEESLRVFRLAGAMIRKSWCLNAHTVLVLPMLGRALRKHAETLELTDAEKSKALRKSALRTAKWGARLTRMFPAGYPMSLRELSLIHKANGRLKESLKYAEKSCQIAENQKAKFELAQSNLLRAQLKVELNLDNAKNEHSEALATMKSFERIIDEITSDEETSFTSI